MGLGTRQDRVDHRQVGADRDAVVEKAGVLQPPVLAVDILLVERPADALRRTALELALDIGRVHRLAGVLDHGVAQDPGRAGFGVDLDIADMRRESRRLALRYTAIQDVGRAIHPSYVEGQMQGGVAQGIGWALNEEYVYDQDGRLENPGFLDYRVPVCSDLPMIDAILVEVPNPRHPFGARGVGEVPIVPPMAAVANAIADATGRAAARSADVAAETARGDRRA